MRAVISITDVLALGDDLQAAGIPLKLHLRDACGGQSCWFEYLGEEDDPSKRETALTRARELVERRLSGGGMRVAFSDDGESFWPAS